MKKSQLSTKSHPQLYGGDRGTWARAHSTALVGTGKPYGYRVSPGRTNARTQANQHAKRMPAARFALMETRALLPVAWTGVYCCSGSSIENGHEQFCRALTYLNGLWQWL
ncbi:MAG: hypothetical protein KME49_27705 [Brasilonema octagenarum HA4186-MV1]|nr:hypothetical protein [Brasilonema octagenarum HA4186-MV1]